MTEVSSKPRGRRWSATRRCVLVRYVVEVGAEPVSVDGWRVAEHREDGVGGHEAMTAHRSQLSDGCPVAGDDEGLSMIKAAHDLTAVVAKLALCDYLCHTQNVALRATHGNHPAPMGSYAQPTTGSESAIWRYPTECPAKEGVSCDWSVESSIVSVMSSSPEPYVASHSGGIQSGAP